VVFVPVVLSGVGAQPQGRVPGAAQAARGYWGGPGRAGQVAELAGRAMRADVSVHQETHRISLGRGARRGRPR
jgi:hypothetical protein